MGPHCRKTQNNVFVIVFVLVSQILIWIEKKKQYEKNAKTKIIMNFQFGYCFYENKNFWSKRGAYRKDNSNYIQGALRTTKLGNCLFGVSFAILV